ncbi:hypothetical protein V6Z12_A10G094700 [Gossypium hirsutum]
MREAPNTLKTRTDIGRYNHHHSLTNTNPREKKRKSFVAEKAQV